MIGSRSPLVALAIVAFAVAQNPCAESATTRIAGWAERGSLPDYGVALEAKLDTGAETASLHAQDIDIYRHDGELHVRFRLNNHRRGGVMVDLPLERLVEIRRHGGVRQERPVVRMRLCVAGVAGVAEVNLVDRSGFDYPLLVGRDFLREAGLVVDSAVTHRVDGQACPLRSQ